MLQQFKINYFKTTITLHNAPCRRHFCHPPQSDRLLCVEVIRIDRGCPDRTFKAAKWDPAMGGDDDEYEDDGGEDDHVVGDCWYARSEGE